MSENQKQSVEGWVERFDEKFPEFEGVGASFPIFKDYPNREHIKKFISNLLSQQQLEVVEAVRKTIKQELEMWNSDGEHYVNVSEALNNVLQSLSTLTTLNNK